MARLEVAPSASTVIVLGLALGAWTGSAEATTVWDADLDFNTTGTAGLATGIGPYGAWSYLSGEGTSLSPFNHVDLSLAEASNKLPPGSEYLYPLWNVGPTVNDRFYFVSGYDADGDGDATDGGLLIVPSYNGDAVVAFTAPVAGDYAFDITVADLDPTAFDVTNDGVWVTLERWSVGGAGSAPQVSVLASTHVNASADPDAVFVFNGLIALSTQETIYLRIDATLGVNQVTYGSAGDATGVHWAISTDALGASEVPEPGTAALAALACGAAFVLRRAPRSKATGSNRSEPRSRARPRRFG